MKILNPEVARLLKLFVVADKDDNLRSGVDKDGMIRVPADSLMEVLGIAEGNFVGATMPVAQLKRIIDKARAGDQFAHETLVLEFHELLDNHIMPPGVLRVYMAEHDMRKLKIIVKYT